MTERARTDIKFEIIERIGVLGSYSTGWNKEFNLVRWNDKAEKYDIRDWSPGHERMSRGVTLHEDEVIKLMDFCSDRFSGNEQAQIPDDADAAPAPDPAGPEAAPAVRETPEASLAPDASGDEVPF